MKNLFKLSLSACLVLSLHACKKDDAVSSTPQTASPTILTVGKLIPHTTSLGLKGNPKSYIETKASLSGDVMSNIVTTTFNFNADGYATLEKTEWSSGSVETTEREYNSLGQVIKDGQMVYTYDEIGRIKSLNGITISYTNNVGTSGKRADDGEETESEIKYSYEEKNNALLLSKFEMLSYELNSNVVTSTFSYKYNELGLRTPIEKRIEQRGTPIETEIDSFDSNYRHLGQVEESHGVKIRESIYSYDGQNTYPSQGVYKRYSSTGALNSTETLTYSYPSFDEKGNWTERIETSSSDSSSKIKYKRIFTY